MTVRDTAASRVEDGDDALLGGWVARHRGVLDRHPAFAQCLDVYGSREADAGAGSRSVRAVAAMRRAIAFARSEGAGRTGAGPVDAAAALRADTLAGLEAETWGAFLMALLRVELESRLQAAEMDAQQRALLGLLAPLTRLCVARQSLAVVSDAVEAAGADPGELLREAQGLAFDEGTTDAIALATLLHADLHAGLAALMGRASACVRNVRAPRLVAAAQQALGALERAVLLLDSGQEPEVLAAGARRLALTLARSLQLSLLCEHAQWLLDHRDDRRGYAAALRYARTPVDLVTDVDPEADRLLLG